MPAHVYVNSDAFQPHPTAGAAAPVPSSSAGAAPATSSSRRHSPSTAGEALSGGPVAASRSIFKVERFPQATWWPEDQIDSMIARFSSVTLFNSVSPAARGRIDYNQLFDDEMRATLRTGDAISKLTAPAFALNICMRATEESLTRIPGTVVSAVQNRPDLINTINIVEYSKVQRLLE